MARRAAPARIEVPPAVQLTREDMMAVVPDMTYRQLHTWTQKGYLIQVPHPAGKAGKGIHVRWMPGEDRVALHIYQLTTLAGFEVTAAAGIARKIANRYRQITLVDTQSLSVIADIAVNTDD